MIFSPSFVWFKTMGNYFFPIVLKNFLKFCENCSLQVSTFLSGMNFEGYFWGNIRPQNVVRLYIKHVLVFLIRCLETIVFVGKLGTPLLAWLLLSFVILWPDTQCAPLFTNLFYFRALVFNMNESDNKRYADKLLNYSSICKNMVSVTTVT